MRKYAKYSKLILCVALLLNLHCECDLGESDGERWPGSLVRDPSIWENLIAWCKVNYERADIYIYNLETKETKRITPDDDLYARYNPKIFGNYVVCLELPEDADPPSSTPLSIVLFEVSSSQKTIIAKGNPEYTNDEPAIYGDWVVWKREPFNPNNPASEKIMLYNIKSRTSLDLTEDEEGNKASPAISEMTVCWISNQSISCYYLDTQKRDAFSFEDIVPKELDVYKNLIVFSAFKKEAYQKNIYVYDIFTKTLQQISFAPELELEEKPKIYNNIIVWEKSESSGLKSIVMFDLNTYETKTIRTAENEWTIPMDPDIWGNYIVWLEPEITIYNIATEEITKIDSK